MNRTRGYASQVNRQCDGFGVPLPAAQSLRARWLMRLAGQFHMVADVHSLHHLVLGPDEVWRTGWEQEANPIGATGLYRAKSCRVSGSKGT